MHSQLAHKNHPKVVGFGLLALLLVVPGFSSISLEPANAAAGTITSGPCSVAVGETTTTSIVASGIHCYVAFKSGINSFTVPANVTNIDYLVVAGGGSGGARHGGGGGAGGLISETGISVSGITSLNVTVGAGGAAVRPLSPPNYAVGLPGNNSSIAKNEGIGLFTTATAFGGGGGEAGGQGPQNGGGSGGGAQSALVSTGTPGQGNNGGQGGQSAPPYWSGGGGGAGAVGGNGTNLAGGNGGAGSIWLSSFTTTIATALSLDQTGQISGNQVYFAGGGGGSIAGGTPTAGSGGLGGGGAANVGAGLGLVGTAGTENSGGGGGGTGCCEPIAFSGAGGSGVVIIRFTSVGINAPSAPREIAVEAKASSLEVSWLAPSNESSHTITGYQVESSTDGTNWTIASTSTSTPYTISGLTDGTPYYVRVAAVTSTRLGAYGYPWMKIYGTAAQNRNSDGTITYQSSYGPGDAPATSNPSFTRVRYLMNASYGGTNNYVDADFSKTLGTASASSGVASNSAITLEKLKFPSIVDKNVIQGDVNDLTIYSNLPISTVQSGYGFQGRLEIWPWNYAVTEASGLAERSAGGIFDNSDTPSTEATEIASYGSFQLHNESASYQQTVFAWNRHLSTSTADIGFGNSSGVHVSGTHTDWTYASSIAGYETRTNFTNEVFVNAPTAPGATTADQTITQTSTSPTSPVVGGTYTPTATSTSSLTVAISIAEGSSSICSISSGIVTFNAVGNCVIEYNQSGDLSYNAAAQVTEEISIGKATPTFSWNGVSKTFGDSTFTVIAPTVTGSLAGSFTYSSATTSVISISGTTFTVEGVGTSVITATFTPTNTADYNSATTDMTVTVSAGAALTPSFGTPTATARGFTVSITNYDSAFTWATPTVDIGSVVVTSTIGSTRILTVTGLSSGAIATITQNTSRSGYANGTATVSGSARTNSGGGGGAGTGDNSPVTGGPSNALNTIIEKVAGGQKVSWSYSSPVTVIVKSFDGTESKFENVSNFLVIADPKPGESTQIVIINPGQPNQILETKSIYRAPLSAQNIVVKEISKKSLQVTWQPSSTVVGYRVVITPTVGAPVIVETIDPKFAVQTAPGQKYTFEVIAIGAGRLESETISKSASLSTGKVMRPLLVVTQTIKAKAFTQNTKFKLAEFAKTIAPDSSILCTGSASSSSRRASAFAAASRACATLQQANPEIFIKPVSTIVSTKKNPKVRNSYVVGISVVIKPIG